MTERAHPPSELGTLLRAYRMRAGLTQALVAERAQMTIRGLQKLERGDSLPYPATVRRLVRALGLKQEERARFEAVAARPTRHYITAGASAAPLRQDPQDGLGVPADEAPGPAKGEWFAFVPIARAPQYRDLLARYESTPPLQADPAILGAVCSRLAYCWWAGGGLSQARATWVRAVELCARGGSGPELAMAHVLLQWCRLAQGDCDQVLLCQEQAMSALERVPGHRWRAWARAVVPCAYALRGRPEPALGSAREALTLAAESGDPDAAACAHGTLCLVHATLGNPADGLEHGALAVDLARAPLEQLWGRAALGWALCRSAEPGSDAADRAIALLEALLAEVQAMQLDPARVAIMLLLAEAYRRAGRPNQAQSTAQAMITSAEPSGMRFHAAVGHRLLGQIGQATASSAPARRAAVEHFQRSIALLREIHASAELELAVDGLAGLQGARGDTW